MKGKRNLAIVLVIMFLLAGCASTGKQATGTTGTSQPSTEAVAFKALTVAFDAYDLGMTSLRMLQKNKIITTATYNQIKEKVAWPLYHAIVAGEAAAEKYAKVKDSSTLAQLTAALEVVAEAQKGFTSAVAKVQGDK